MLLFLFPAIAVLGTVVLSVVLQAEALGWPIVVGLLALLAAFPFIDSAIVGWLRKISNDAWVKPQTLVWLVSAVVIGVGMFTAGGSIPAFDLGNPVATVGAWLVFAKAYAGYTEVLYDVLLKRWVPKPPE